MLFTKRCFEIDDVVSIGLLSRYICIYFAWAIKPGDWWTDGIKKRFLWAKKKGSMYTLFIGRLAIMVVFH
jgi:hypothetical protein